MFWKAGQINWDAISRCSCCPRLNESVVVFYIGFKAYLKLVSRKVVSGTGLCHLMWLVACIVVARLSYMLCRLVSSTVFADLLYLLHICLHYGAHHQKDFE